MSETTTAERPAREDKPERKEDAPAQQQGGGEQEKDEGQDDQAKDDGPKKPSLFKRPLFWVVLVLVVGGLVVGGLLWWLNARQYESTDNAFIDSHIVRIAPTVAGTLTQVADVDNRHVEAGRLLAVIEPEGRTAQAAEAQAGVTQAQAQAEQARAQITAALATAAQARAQAQVPVAAAIKAQQDLARYRALQRLDSGAVAATQLDAAESQARQTAADAAAARKQIDAAESQIAVARRQAAAARAGIGQRRAQLQQAEVTLGDLRLTAPVSGQVTNRQVNVGSYVGPGTQLLAIVPDRIWVTANFKETQLKLMRVGQPVDIEVDAFPGVHFKGRVDSFQRGAGQAFAVLPPQNATGNYVKVVQRVPVRIEFDIKHGPDPRRYPIGPGMSVVPTVKVR